MKKNEPLGSDVTLRIPLASRYSIWLLTGIYIFNFVDRQIMTIVAEPIKADFRLSDSQLGAMTGLSFAILYTLCGLPLAQLAERGDRSRIIGVSVIVWSGFTALCGVTRSFPQLVLARIGVGLGEAGCTPPAHSLISDLVPRAKRASSLAIYSMGAPLGQLIGMAMGGIAAARWGWRSAFFIAGAPGILLSFLALRTLSEPRRAEFVRDGAHRPIAADMRGTIGALVSNRSFMFVAFGAAAAAFVFYGLGAFYASFFLRNHAEQLAGYGSYWHLKPIGFLGIALGLTGGVAGVSGALIGGRVADIWVAQNKAAHVLLPALCNVAAVPFLLGALLVSDLSVSILLIAIASFLNSTWAGAAYAAALGLVDSRSRATASALMLFILNLIGLGLGPLFVGFLSDIVASNTDGGFGLRFAMICTALVGFLAAGLFWRARTGFQTGPRLDELAQ